MVRVTAGVEAHTHEYIATAHEDQKFGFSITSGDAFEAVRRLEAAPGIDLLGLHSHIGSQIFDSSGFEVAARRVLALHHRVSDELGVTMPEMDLGGGFGIAYTTQDDPSDPAQLATEMGKIVEHECRALGIEEPRLSIEPGRAIVGPAMCTVYTVGTVKPVTLDAGAVRTYVSVDGGMSDNIRTALYDADYSCTLAGRGSEARRCSPGWSASTARPATSSSATSSSRVTSLRAICWRSRAPVPTVARWPPTTTIAPSARDRGTGRSRARRRPAGD